MKAIITGSKDFNSIESMEECIESLGLDPITEVICCGSKGADTVGANWAMKHNIPVKVYLPKWDEYGYAAALIRNNLIAKYTDILIAFWDGESPGTKNIINIMYNLGKEVYTFKYK